MHVPILQVCRGPHSARLVAMGPCVMAFISLRWPFRCGVLLCRQSKGHITKQDLTEGLRIASPSVFEALHSSGSLESELDQEFAALDANGDGVVTLDEFRAALSCPVPAASHQPSLMRVSAH